MPVGMSGVYALVELLMGDGRNLIDRYRWRKHLAMVEGLVRLADLLVEARVRLVKAYRAAAGGRGEMSGMPLIVGLVEAGS